MRVADTKVWQQQIQMVTSGIRTFYSPGQRASARAISASLVVRIAVFVVLYYVFEYWIRRPTSLPMLSYTQPILALELIKGLLTGFIPLIGLVILLIVALACRASLLHRWQVFDQGQALRLLISLVVTVCAWIYSTYDYNFYFDQGHYLDRLILCGLMVLVWWRPIFVLPFTLLLMAIMGQFTYPLADQVSLLVGVNLLVHTLQLFGVFFILHLVTGTQLTADFIFVLCCLIGASYLYSGVGKLQLGWLNSPHIHLLMLGGYSNGWLGFLPPEPIVSVVKFLSNFAIPMMLFTLLVELGSLVYMAHQRLTMIFLLLFIAFHVGIVVVCGIFFWHWIVLEVALFVFFYRIRHRPFELHTRAHFLLSLILIGGGSLWFRTVNLAWYDTALQYTYHYEGITTSGQKVMLPNNLFSPYSDLFTFQNFNFLNHETQLTGTYGVTLSSRIAEDLATARDAETIFALEQKYSVDAYSAAHAAQLTDLIARFTVNLNRSRDWNPSWWSVIQPPHHLLSFPREGEFWDRSEPIEKVIVYQYTTFFDGEIYSLIRKRIVLEVLIDTPI